MKGQSQALRGLFVPKTWIIAHLVAGLSLWSAGGFAASETERPAVLPADPMTANTLMQLVLGMILVLGLIAVSAWLLRRFNRFQSAASGQLKIVGGLSMGARERVVLVQIGEQQLLLGVAPGRVQTLHVLDEPLSNTRPANPASDSGFAQRLQSVLRQGEAKRGGAK